MGACVSTHHKPSAMKVHLSFGSKDNKLVIPLSPAKERPPVANGDVAVKSQWPPSQSTATFRDFGSKDENFFDSQAWLESDCDDDFMSVKGDFTPSRGNTPVHHSFSAGTPQVNGGVYSLTNNKPPVSAAQTSPSVPEKKMRLSDLFKQSLSGNHEYDDSEEENAEPATKNGMNRKGGSPLVSEATSAHSGEMGPIGGGLKPKRLHGCFPSLLSSCSSSMNGRKKKMSPSLSPNPVAG